MSSCACWAVFPANQQFQTASNLLDNLFDDLPALADDWVALHAAFLQLDCVFHGLQAATVATSARRALHARADAMFQFLDNPPLFASAAGVVESPAASGLSSSLPVPPPGASSSSSSSSSSSIQAAQYVRFRLGVPVRVVCVCVCVYACVCARPLTILALATHANVTANTVRVSVSVSCV